MAKQIVREDFLPDFYKKPSGGIPKTDLEAAVQASLGKAESALQSFTETDPVYSADKPSLASKLDVSSAVTVHDSSSTAHTDIRSDISRVEAIARGRSRAITFNTLASLSAWLGGAVVPETTLTVSDLLDGDNLYVRESGVPDYWWDGTQALILETEKVDLSNIYTKPEADGRFAPINASLTAETGSGTDTSTGAVASTGVPALLQMFWNKFCQFKNVLATKLTANTAITGGTKTKITYDSKGLVTGGADLAASDIPDLDASKIVSGTFPDARIASAATWNAKQNALSRWISTDDNSTGDIIDNGQNLTIPLTVSPSTSGISNSSPLPPGTFSLRTAIHRFIENITYILSELTARYTKTESDAKFEQVSRKDLSIPQTPTAGNYPATSAVKAYVDGMISGITTQLFFYSFDYGQSTSGAPNVPLSVTLAVGDELYNFYDGKNYYWNGVSWDDITYTITKVPVDGSTAFIQKMFVDGQFAGHPGSVIYEITGSYGTWYPFPQSITMPDDVTIEFTGNGALGIKNGSVDSSKIAVAVMALIDGAAQASDVTTALATKVDKVSGKGLSTNDFDGNYKARLDFEGSENLAGNSLSNLAITKHISHISVSGTQSFTVASVVVNNKAFVVDVLATAAATINLPSTGTYINMSADNTYTLAANERIEIQCFYSTASSKYHITSVKK